jgi:hypothetical protein
MNMNLIRTKTFWTGVAALLGAAGAYLTGEATLAGAGQMAVSGLLAIFLRQGILKLPQD